MEMQQIRYFLALCEEQGFTRAARRCGVSQPSLTRGILLLEKELGGRLFERRHRGGSRLTALGARVRPYLAQAERAVTDARHVATQPHATLPTLIIRKTETAMRKLAVAGIVALIIAVTLTAMPMRAAFVGSPQLVRAANLVDIRAVEATIDLKALPNGDVDYEN